MTLSAVMIVYVLYSISVLNDQMAYLCVLLGIYLFLGLILNEIYPFTTTWGFEDEL